MNSTIRDKGHCTFNSFPATGSVLYCRCHQFLLLRMCLEERDLAKQKLTIVFEKSAPHENALLKKEKKRKEKKSEFKQDARMMTSYRHVRENIATNVI